MGYKLCTAEKPSVAKDIARVIGADKKEDGYYIGNGYIVTWAVGHLVGLAEPEEYGYVKQSEMYLDDEAKARAYGELPLIPREFKLVVLEPTKKQFEIVKKLMHREDVELIIDCGDMGPEGHILQWLIREKAGNVKPVKRFCATSMTDEAILYAMNNLRNADDFLPVIRGEFCKKKEDWILGMSLSRALSIKYNAALNVGRVQSPTLAFVVKRYLEVVNFKETNYFALQADVDAEGVFSIFWNKDNDGVFPSEIKTSDGKVLEKSALDAKCAEINSYKCGTVSDIITTKKANDRPQLYDITELQRDANKRFGYSAAVTLATAQALYETQKVLSYPRTDSRYITSDLIPYMTERVKMVGTIPKYSKTADVLAGAGLNIDKKIVDDEKVTDHHALIPTERIKGFDASSMIPTDEERKKGVTANTLSNVLDLVLTRFLVAFSTAYKYEQTKITVSFDNGLNFSANGKKVLSYGWQAVQNSLIGKLEDEERNRGDYESPEQELPILSKGQQINVVKCSVVSKKTSAPKLHTEATLLTAMENAGQQIENGAILKGKGIGTQATRAEIIKKLFDTGVVETEGKGKTPYIKPTQKGLSVIRVLPADLYSPKITADWETKIADIVSGVNDEYTVMKEFENYITEKTEQIKQTELNVSFAKEKEVFGYCPWCNSPVYRFQNKNEKGKVVETRFYCSENCDWNLKTNDLTFQTRLGRNITEAEAKRFIAKKFIVLDCVKQGGGATYRGEFTFYERQSNGKRYCNIKCELAKAKKK